MTRYRKTNWKAYNAALKARGALLIWLDPAMNSQGRSSGKRGRSPTFSDEAVQFCRARQGSGIQYTWRWLHAGADATLFLLG
jgi:hypothetical protein